MFSAVNLFQMFKPGSVNSKCGLVQNKTREPIKSNRTASNFTKRPRLEMAKEDTAHIKSIKNNKISINILPKILTENIQM